jgi:hypothetical protein
MAREILAEVGEADESTAPNRNPPVLADDSDEPAELLPTADAAE